MIIDENRPEPNEGKVTYTYDHLDRLLYRNVYQGDAAHRRGTKNTNDNPTVIKVAGARKPKKLLYQDYYTYNNNGLRSVRRIYQPIVETPTLTLDDNGYTVKANILCKSPIIASGFIWINETNADTAKAKLMYKSMYTQASLAINVYNINPFDLGDGVEGIRFIGREAVGTISYPLNSGITHYLKAYAQVETGTLFSKTIHLQEI